MPTDPWSLIQQAADIRGADRHASLIGYAQAAGAAHNDPVARAHALRHVADLNRELGRIDAASVAAHDAVALYRDTVDDRMGLANSLRLVGLIDSDAAAWTEARALYAREMDETGLPLAEALAECDRRLARLRPSGGTPHP